jgi:hypothetical protein
MTDRRLLFYKPPLAAFSRALSSIYIFGFLKINNSIAFFVENKEEGGEGRKGRDPR